MVGRSHPGGGGVDKGGVKESKTILPRVKVVVEEREIESRSLSYFEGAGSVRRKDQTTSEGNTL